MSDFIAVMFICGAQFTRSDLLARHKKGCTERTDRTRRKSCVSCTESKIKCDREIPCGKCAFKGKECVYAPSTRKAPNRKIVDGLVLSVPGTSSSAASDHAPPAPETFDSLNYVPSLEGSSSYQGPPSDAGFSSSIASSSYQDSTATGTETDVQLLEAANQLTSMYNGDMFQPLFSNVFASLDSQPLAGDSPPYEPGNPSSGSSFPFDLFFGERVPFQEGLTSFQDIPTFPEPSIQPAVSHVRHVLPSSTPEETMDPEHKHYLQLFYTVFLEQMPIVHPHTFSIEGRPPLLISAMQACGALYVKTRQAANFILNTLTAARGILVDEFARITDASSADQLNLIIAVVLLQTVGLFHQKADQRAHSYLYHGMLVMMVKRSAYLSKISGWSPEAYATLPLDLQWREWALHETAKRAVLLSYLHDCCQAIYFSLPTQYEHSEMDIYLPCENGLWEAKSPEEWWMKLEQQSAFGDYHSRLTGPRMLPAVAAVMETRFWDIVPPPLSPFAHWIVIHAILRRMFAGFSETLNSAEALSGVKSTTAEQEICIAQYSLHNWLQSWISCPEHVNVSGEDEEPPFMQHPLPFYWLGQITLMAYQEGLPPFQSQSQKKDEVRLHLVKQWLKHIRGFLKKGGDASTRVWDELMRIRLQSDADEDKDEKDDGLLGFFAET
ncbi:hypothetical protein V5O48_002252 [Marasmius crinis-equi]|uniref:Zn(2)-C6 fungal-type domain-containing protein n=1 Tax=Marasmius crinis-equi TaxID=585013 RepID=A0ABR3FWQ6_9AGAR